MALLLVVHRLVHLQAPGAGEGEQVVAEAGLAGQDEQDGRGRDRPVEYMSVGTLNARPLSDTEKYAYRDLLCVYVCPTLPQIFSTSLSITQKLLRDTAPGWHTACRNRKERTQCNACVPSISNMPIRR